MTLVDSITERLKLEEGFRAKVYWDTAKPPRATIGYGFNITDTPLPKPVADFWLNYLVKETMEAVAKNLPWSVSLSEARQAVLVDMAYNMGIGGLLGFSVTPQSFLPCLKRGDYEGAAKAMLKSKYAKDVGQRAINLAEMIRKG